MWTRTFESGREAAFSMGNKTCFDCEHIRWIRDTVTRLSYLGDSYRHIRCRKGYWELQNRLFDERDYRDHAASAETCDDFVKDTGP